MSATQYPGRVQGGERPDATLRKCAWLFGIEGVLMIVLGAIGLAMPALATLTVELMIGWLFLFSGIVGLVAMFWARDVGGFLWTLFASVLSGIAGVLLLARPGTGILSLTIVLTAYFLVQGVMLFVAALETRKLLPGAWGWVLVNGLIDIALAVLIIAGWPVSAAWMLGVFACVNLICNGTSLLMLSIAAGEIGRTA